MMCKKFTLLIMHGFLCPFHKTLLRSSALVNWISVRYFETGCTSKEAQFNSQRHRAGLHFTLFLLLWISIIKSELCPSVWPVNYLYLSSMIRIKCLLYSYTGSNWNKKKILDIIIIILFFVCSFDFQSIWEYV